MVSTARPSVPVTAWRTRACEQANNQQGSTCVQPLEKNVLISGQPSARAITPSLVTFRHQEMSRYESCWQPRP